MNVLADLTCLCKRKEFEAVFTYHEPPAGEIRFHPGADKPYFRRILRCHACGHFLSVHDMDMSDLYRQQYVNSTYGQDGIRQAFERIVALDPAKSDNVGRVKRIVEFARQYFSDNGLEARSVLDVGSGLCIFLHQLRRETGWECTALDPDPRAAAHAQEYVGINALCGDFMELDERSRYDVITFNKVLEHVVDPVSMLARSRRNLNPNGFIYIELPDGEVAGADSQDREEFFIDHCHIFSAESAVIMARRAGFVLRELERICEPSSKYTLRAFLVRAPDKKDA